MLNVDNKNGGRGLNVLYFSDLHSKTKYLPQFKTAVDIFDKEHKNEHNIKIAAGDINADTALLPNKLILKILNYIGLDAASVGNHDLEGGDFWAKAYTSIKPKFSFLSANLEYLKPNKIEEFVKPSQIIDCNGLKVGVIGASPIDYGKLSFIAPFNDYVNVLGFEESKDKIKKEVEELEQKGIDKIILLAHTGDGPSVEDKYYQELAQIGGIDFIQGGHDHKEVDKWYLSKRNEPVRVVAVGKNGDEDVKGEDLDKFGVASLMFDEDGVLIPSLCKNRFEITDNYKPSLKITRMIDEYLKNGEIIGISNRSFECNNKMIMENPTGSLCADAMLYGVNKRSANNKAQIAFVNSGTVRGFIQSGEIKNSDVRETFPFTSSTLIKTKLTKKQIFDTLNWCASSIKFQKVEPGLMQVGGLSYTIKKEGGVKDVYIIDSNGKKLEKLDEKPEDKTYEVVYDIFLLTGVAGLRDLVKDPSKEKIEYFPLSRQDVLKEYIKECFSDNPVEIKGKRIIKE